MILAIPGNCVYIIGKNSQQTLYYLSSNSEGYMSDEFYDSREENVSWYILKRNSSSPSGSTTPVNVPWYYEKITLGDYTEGTLYDAVGQNGLANASIGQNLAEENDVQNNSVCIVDSYKLDDGTYVFFYYAKDSLGQVSYNGQGIDDSVISYAEMK